MKIGIIGMGHLGKATLEGLIKSGVAPEEIFVNARTEKTLKALEEAYPGIAVRSDKRDLVSNVEVLIIIVRPQDASEVMSELKGFDLSNKTLISLMAGVRIGEMREMLQDHQRKYRIIRMMPNVGVALCKGVIGVSIDEDKEEYGQELEFFSKMGYLVYLPEDQLESITITAASGVGFAAYLMKQYQDACDRLIKDPVVSEEITKRVFETTIDLVRKDQSSFEKLIEQISTKGGTTEAGLGVMINSELGDIVNRSFDEAISRVKK